jgi:palmitoyltransferase
MYYVCKVYLAFSALFFVYILYQGITTYDYVVAMRAMSEGLPEDEEGANIIYSPSNSATTGFSVGSSLGLHHKGAWCTPPRIFIDHVSCVFHVLNLYKFNHDS